VRHNTRVPPRRDGRPEIEPATIETASTGFPPPLDRFRALLAQARAAGVRDPTAHVVATASGGMPSARYVLLKGVDARGFVFFTNYGSRKARDLAATPHAALCFHWPPLGLEVRARGPVERLTAGESDAYFATRPYLSRIGAWASRQSAPTRGRLVLLLRVLLYALRFLGRVPRPSFWGGYRVRAEAVVVVRESGGIRELRAYHREGEVWTETETRFEYAAL
jgi:pyridoxamine 5'-phosphate oxidase